MGDTRTEHEVIDYAHGERTYDFGGQSVRQLTATRRELNIALGFARPGSPVRSPILRKMTAIEDEIAERHQRRDGQ